VVLLAAVTVALAAPPAGLPPRLSQQRSSAWNQHRVGGASGHRYTSTVTVSFVGADGVRVEDDGESRDTDLDSRFGFTETIRRWKQTWTGTHSGGGSAPLVLRLRLQDHRCRRTKAHDHGPAAADGDCPPRARERVLTCVAGSLEVRTALPPSAGTRREPGWTCSATPAEEAGPATPLPWTFARRGCLEVVPAFRHLSGHLQACSQP
jgi:hypothetical protein